LGSAVNPYVRLDRRPDLHDPALVCAFHGWNDGGEAATVAARYLIERWSATPVGRLDPEEFYDFQENRPTVRLVDGVTRVIEWPAAVVSAATPPGRDVLFLVAPEPTNRWRTFTEAVVDTSKDLGVTLLVTLGGFLSDVPYTHDVPVMGSARTTAEAERMGLTASRYEGPTGIVGVLHDAANRSGLSSVSLWAAVPHYLPAAPNPKAALALVRRAAELLGVIVDTRALVRAVDRWERGVARLLEESDELSEYVARLESAAGAPRRDDEEHRGPTLHDDEPIASGESIAAELERFLKDQSSGGGAGPEGPST
jgi:predicted ATP-grasp superfamily ATP-dependent carboligase